jgi:hypothetical protein
VRNHPTGTGLPIRIDRIAAPGSRYYQVWYRNAAAFCTTGTFNLTNGLQLDWVQ